MTLRNSSRSSCSAINRSIRSANVPLSYLTSVVRPLRHPTHALQATVNYRGCVAGSASAAIRIGNAAFGVRCIPLRERFGGLILSSVYESEAGGFDGQPFLNLVAGFDSGEPVSVLLTALQSVEDSFGRVRSPNKFAPRTLDLDLLTYGDPAGTIDGCTLPPDEILYHAFVLGPLAEVAAQEHHSTGGCCYGELWRAFEKSAPPLRPVAFEF